MALLPAEGFTQRGMSILWFPHFIHKHKDDICTSSISYGCKKFLRDGWLFIVSIEQLKITKGVGQLGPTSTYRYGYCIYFF